jgi:beta-N-acetylhexosaminidase
MTRGKALARRSVLLGLPAALAACGNSRPSGSVRLSAPGPWPSPSASAPPVTRASVSPRQLAGQRVIFSYPGLTPPSSLLRQIAAGEAAGVIFFGENVSSQAQIAAVIKKLNAANAASPVRAPLLLMTDQEGGMVSRLPGAPFLSEKQIGESSDPAAVAAKAGNSAGSSLAGIGLNVNLAPVLDVHRRTGNFIDEFERSYSSKPVIVSECGSAFIAAQQAAGVAATAKHFPGLGAAAKKQNTDLGPVTLRLSLSELRAVDEQPYPAAIAAGVKLIMASWAVYPSLDAHLPAGLSSAVVQGELRGRLGFQGVTVTDALEAEAISSFGSYSGRAVLAAEAGMDLILASARDVSQGQSVVNGLAAALETGDLGRSEFNAAAGRVNALRYSLR